MRTLCHHALAVVFMSAAGVVPCFAQATTAPVAPDGRGTAPRQFVPVVPTGPELRGISVVLVEGDLATVTSNSTLPAAAAKALADMKDFLPYKGYRVLDTQWTLGAGRIAVRLRGTGGHEYDLELTASYPHYDTQARIRQLAARGIMSTTTAESGIAGLSITEFKLRDANRMSANTPSLTLKQDDAALIATAFRMDVGETVVVGTSRLQGDKALIVLLTAVAK
jgi:hypothetical protein